MHSANLKRLLVGSGSGIKAPQPVQDAAIPSMPKNARERAESAMPELDPTQMPSIAESREILLDAIGDAPDMTFIRTTGNLGDELIWAGTRRLLEGHIYREIAINDVAASHGELAVICGGGAWSRRYNVPLPEVLAVAELRFERVIVFPSSFEIAEDRVRAALEATNALVFAREIESYKRIQGSCRARLAHDCAVFADYSDYTSPGSGELNVFRTDDERSGAFDPPSDNDDISLTADSLDSWLRKIESHAVVKTDRAHVMIAAALMGKRVNYGSCNYFKVDALAETLPGFDIHPLEPATSTNTSTRHDRANDSRSARVAVAVVGRDDAPGVATTVESVDGDDVQVTILDRNSLPQVRSALDELVDDHEHVDVVFADRDSGVAANLRLAAELADAEYVLFLEPRMRLRDGALQQLVAALDAHADAAAVAAALLDETGIVRSCGGWIANDGESISIRPTWAIESTQLAETGWVPPLGTLIRRSALDSIPLRSDFDVFCQNVDWCLRVKEQNPGGLLACPSAEIEKPTSDAMSQDPSFGNRSQIVGQLPAHAAFFTEHGRVLGERLAELIPELRLPSGEVNYSATRVVLDRVMAGGIHSTLIDWMNGDLVPLVEEPISDSERKRHAEIHERVEWLELRNESLIGIENGTWWRLRGKLAPLRRVVTAVRR